LYSCYFYLKTFHLQTDYLTRIRERYLEFFSAWSSRWREVKDRLQLILKTLLAKQFLRSKQKCCLVH